MKYEVRCNCDIFQHTHTRTHTHTDQRQPIGGDGTGCEKRGRVSHWGVVCNLAVAVAGGEPVPKNEGMSREGVRVVGSRQSQNRKIRNDHKAATR
eukprot:1194368-Prorocentrum_minimum.AAC.6